MECYNAVRLLLFLVTTQVFRLKAESVSTTLGSSRDKSSLRKKPYPEKPSA